MSLLLPQCNLELDDNFSSYSDCRTTNRKLSPLEVHLTSIQQVKIIQKRHGIAIS